MVGDSKNQKDLFPLTMALIAVICYFGELYVGRSSSALPVPISILYMTGLNLMLLVSLGASFIENIRC